LYENILGLDDLLMNEYYKTSADWKGKIINQMLEIAMKNAFVLH